MYYAVGGCIFELNCRFQIAAILVLLIIVMDYIKNPHLKLRSSRYFRVLIFLTAVNLCLDLATVYTITHLSEAMAEWNRRFHQMFIASVILMLFTEYLYIRMLAYNQKRMTMKELSWTLLPIAIAALVIAFGNLEYYISERAAYSYGAMAYTVYICSFIYLIMGLRLAFAKEGYLTKSQRSSVLLGCGIWICAMIVQMIFPHILLSGLGFVLMVLSIYFSHENQRENYDVDTDSFNRNAFNRMLAENYAKKRPLFLVNLTCENLDRINLITGRDKANEALKYLKNVLEKHTRCEVYHSRENIFSIFRTRDIKYFMNKLQAIEAELMSEEYSDFRLNCHISVMDLRKYTQTWNEVDGILDFMRIKLQNGASKICFLNEDIIKDKQRKDQIDLLLDEAIENDGFEMVYQPIYNSEKRTFTSAEALIRFKNCGDLGFVSPEEFIPLAEEKGLILDIGDRALELVAEFAATNHLPETTLEYIEVNLSAIQAAFPRLDTRLKEIVNRYQLPASFINLEITETATVNFGKTFENNIIRLRELGFSFSMDDFGTGYSNLAKMNQINYDLVKLDKSLIWPAFDEDKEQAKQAEILLRSVIKLLKSIGVKIVAEGVETEHMVNYLKENGVEYLQGYYFSKPISGDKFLTIINNL